MFAHLPLIVNEKRKKLSKRRDDVSVGDYIDRGYLPEAMVNYLATLGWGPPDGVEIRPLAEIVELFRLEDVNTAGAFFDLKKLDHFNGEYIRALPVDEFIEPLPAAGCSTMPPWPPERFDADGVRGPGPARAGAGQAPRRGARLRRLPVPAEPVDRRRRPGRRSWSRTRRPPRRLLDAVLEIYLTCEWEPGVLDGDGQGRRRATRAAEEPVPGGGVRVAVTGRAVGPPLGEAMQLLGRDEVVRRLRDARARITV